MKNYVEKLKVFQADQTVFYTKLHNLHWFVEGSSFFTLHAEFEKMYDEVTAVLDEVAERILQLGGKPLPTLTAALELATIKERDTAGGIGGRESVEIAVADFKNLAAQAKEIVSLAAQAGDDGTADQFTGYLRGYEKLLWLLDAYLK